VSGRVWRQAQQLCAPRWHSASVWGSGVCWLPPTLRPWANRGTTCGWNAGERYGAVLWQLVAPLNVAQRHRVSSDVCRCRCVCLRPPRSCTQPCPRSLSRCRGCACCSTPPTSRQKVHRRGALSPHLWLLPCSCSSRIATIAAAACVRRSRSRGAAGGSPPSCTSQLSGSAVCRAHHARTSSTRRRPGSRRRRRRRSLGYISATA
jgi:hypothetical protein